MDSKKLLRNLTVGQGQILAPHIDAYQNRQQFPDEWAITIANNRKSSSDSIRFYPSVDVFTDPVTLWKEKKGLIIPSPKTGAFQRAMDVGDFWHGYLQSILIDMGFVNPKNVEKYLIQKIITKRGSCDASGRADLVDVKIPGQGLWLIDIKSMNKKAFDAGADATTLLKWTAQLSCYMDWLNVDKAMVLAISKDSPHNFREYNIQKDQGLLDMVYDKWTYVMQCIRVDIEPSNEEYEASI